MLIPEVAKAAALVATPAGGAVVRRAGQHPAVDLPRRAALPAGPVPVVLAVGGPGAAKKSFV